LSKFDGSQLSETFCVLAKSFSELLNDGVELRGVLRCHGSGTQFADSIV